MTRKYSGIGELLKYDRDALHYFESLSDDVRAQIAPHGQHVNSFEELVGYVESLKTRKA